MRCMRFRGRNGQRPHLFACGQETFYCTFMPFQSFNKVILASGHIGATSCRRTPNEATVTQEASNDRAMKLCPRSQATAATHYQQAIYTRLSATDVAPSRLSLARVPLIDLSIVSTLFLISATLQDKALSQYYSRSKFDL